MIVLITDALSILGQNLIALLSEQEALQIRALYPTHHTAIPEHYKNILNLECIPMDYQDPKTLASLVMDTELVFHNYFLCSYRNQDRLLLSQHNILFTQKLLQACLDHKIARMVYTSGMEMLLANTKGEFITEQDGISEDDLTNEFEISRLAAERMVMEYIKLYQLPVIITHPTLLLGESEDTYHAWFYQLLKLIFQNKLPNYFALGLNIIPARDAAKGHILAAKHGKIGARYILGHTNIYLKELIDKISEKHQTTSSAHLIPYWWSKLMQQLHLNPLPIPLPLYRRFKDPLFFNTQKAISELKLPQSDLWQTLDQMIKNTLSSRASEPASGW